LLARLCKENQHLLAGQRTTARGLEFKEYFSVKGLMSKYKSMRKKYMIASSNFKVGRHPVRGETGAAAEGLPQNKQESMQQQRLGF
jgi:hypothetical protein